MLNNVNLHHLSWWVSSNDLQCLNRDTSACKLVNHLESLNDQTPYQLISRFVPYFTCSHPSLTSKKSSVTYHLPRANDLLHLLLTVVPTYSLSSAPTTISRHHAIVYCLSLFYTCITDHHITSHHVSSHIHQHLGSRSDISRLLAHPSMIGWNDCWSRLLSMFTWTVRAQDDTPISTLRCAKISFPPSLATSHPIPSRPLFPHPATGGQSTGVQAWSLGDARSISSRPPTRGAPSFRSSSIRWVSFNKPYEEFNWSAIDMSRLIVSILYRSTPCNQTHHEICYRVPIVTDFYPTSRSSLDEKNTPSQS